MASILEPSKSVCICLYTQLFILFGSLNLLGMYEYMDFLTSGFGFLMQSFFPAMTKIVGTLGPKSRSVDTISGCLKTGMSGIIHMFYVAV